MPSKKTTGRQPPGRPPEQLLLELQVHQVELELQNEELRRAQVRLDVARARYFDLYDLAPIGYCTLDDHGVIVQVNLTAVTMLGLARSVGLGQALSRFIHPEDQAAFHALLRRVVDTAERQSAELRMLITGGAMIWAHLVITTAVNEAGAAERRVVLSDVTARREAELARREGETRYRDLFSRASDGILLCSPEGAVFDVNEAFARMHGLTAREVATLNLRALDERSVALAPDRLHRMAQGEVLAFELEHRHRGGHLFAVEASTSQVTIAGAARVLGFYRDVSERRRLRARLAQHERLAGLGMLAVGIAHELDAPLRAVLSNLERLSEALAAAARAQARDEAPAAPAFVSALVDGARDALDGARRIKQISNGLGAFSPLDPVALESVDLNAALMAAAGLAHHELEDRAQVSTNLGELPPVRASQAKLTQVFLNLLINAGQAIGEGHAGQHRITLSSWASGNEVFAEIADTGPGIPPENLERVFEPFFTTRVGPGTGLGLTLCRSILAELGGDVQVTSGPGAQTRFLVRLPRGEDQPPEAAPPVSAAAQVAPHGRVLVIGHEEPLRKELRRLLGKQHEVVSVESGRQARAMLQMDSSFDVVICDLTMPANTGMELHAWLLTYAPGLAARVVFVTGGAFTARAVAFLSSVPNPTLSQPFEVAELRALVNRLVERR